MCGQLATHSDSLRPWLRGGLQNRSGCDGKEKVPPPIGNRITIVQSVASPFTGSAQLNIPFPSMDCAIY